MASRSTDLKKKKEIIPITRFFITENPQNFSHPTILQNRKKKFKKGRNFISCKSLEKSNKYKKWVHTFRRDCKASIVFDGGTQLLLNGTESVIRSLYDALCACLRKNKSFYFFFSFSSGLYPSNSGWCTHELERKKKDGSFSHYL